MAARANPRFVQGSAITGGWAGCASTGACIESGCAAGACRCRAMNTIRRSASATRVGEVRGGPFPL